MFGVLQKFLCSALFMWITPIAILYGYKHHIIPGSSELSSSSQTLLSGFLAIIAVNVVIAIYIFMALKEPSSSEPQPDPAFLADAKASISKSMDVGNQAREKVE